jgi:hypothetical protein
MGEALQAVNLGSGRTVVEVVTGNAHTCVRLDNGDVKCWGHGDLGRLGSGGTAHIADGWGEMGEALQAVDLGSGRTAVEVVAGGEHTCARIRCRDQMP